MKPLAELRVEDAMTADPVTIGPEDSLMEALQLMRLRKIRRVLVVLEGALIGIVAEGDVKRAEPSTLEVSEQEFNKTMEETQVSRIMIRDPITVDADVPLKAAVHTLHTTKFGSLPVLRDGVVVGILTDNDVLRVFLEVLEQSG
jgi:acetoin utilization protein AcuB